ncbi:MAG: hypothetical protein ACR2QT_03545 [Woeseiaceae bacterium]
MNDKSAVHWSFWVIGALALVWNALGGVNYIMQMNPDIVASFPDTQKAIINGRPAWATGGFAVGVFGGAIGAILLLLRKPLAVYVFIASLLGILVTMIHTFQVVRSPVEFTTMEVFVMMVLPAIVAVFLVLYSKTAGQSQTAP